MLQHIGKDSGNCLPPFDYLKAPSYPSYLSFPFSHLFCPALSPTHRPHRFSGNPGWLAPGTQLCLKKSPTAKHYGKQQTVGMVRVGDRLQNSTTGRFCRQPHHTHQHSYTPCGIWHCWGVIRPLSISVETGTFHPAVRPYPVWHDLRPRRSSRLRMSWLLFFTTAIA